MFYDARGDELHRPLPRRHPGRKNLIWFSGSFPISVFPTGKDKQQTDAMRQYGTAIRKTADLLTCRRLLCTRSELRA